MLPFALRDEDLTNLNPDLAVEFFRRLLWAEAARVGIGKNLIDVPSCINVGDGGIDAYIKDAKHLIDEIIPQGTSGFQIKSSDLSPEECKKELHQGKDLKKPIKPEIKRLLDQDGIYVLVLFANITNQQKSKREQAIKDELDALGYNKVRLRLYTANQLTGFAELFPSLVTWIKNDFIQCLPYSSWSDNGDVKIPKLFVFDEVRKKWMEDICQKLRDQRDECLIFRITGLSGIGKTRFIFESLSSYDLKQRVIYVRADQFRLSNLYNTLQNDSKLSVILVIDECDLLQHDEFVRSFSGRGSRLAVFTISNEISNVSPPSMLYCLKPLPRNEVEEILKSEAPQLPNDVIRRLSEFADGYPRIVVLLKESYLLTGTTQENFLTISDEALLNRLISGRFSIDPDLSKITKKVLMGLSLFKMVGYEGKISKESEYVSKIVKVEWSDFKAVVTKQKRRGIIQGKYYIYVTPFMLRIHLLREWWESYGLSTDSFNKFIKDMPEEFRTDLLQRFFEHIPYVTTTERGKEFASAVLGKTGVFEDGSLLKTKLGANFFLKLTEADPESALECLKRTVGNWSKEELLRFTTGRREVVMALEISVVHKNLFRESARLLLTLGEAENEIWSNNASGLFTELFSPALGKVSPSEASPQERFPILKEALESSSKERRMLALRACNEALESRYYVRGIGAEYQGLRKEPQLWKPKKWGDLFNAYSKVWHLLAESLDNLPSDERQEAVDILIQRAQSLVRLQNLIDMVIDTLKNLMAKPYVDNRQILEGIIRLLRYVGKELPEEKCKLFEELKEQLTGNDFNSLMRRYVSMNLIEDTFIDKHGKRINQAQPWIEKLALQAVEDSNLVLQELDWLVTDKAQNGYYFGYELGKRDKDFSLLPELIKAQQKAKENARTIFLGGYFRAIFEKDKEVWEDQLDDLLRDEKLITLIPDLTWRSGMSDRAALRILDIAQKHITRGCKIDEITLGIGASDISEGVFKKWIEFLLSCAEIPAITTALCLHHSYYCGAEISRTLPEELTLKLLTHKLLFQKPESGRRDQMDDYYWTEIGNAFIRKYPEKSLDLVGKMLEHFGEDGTIFEGFHSQAQSLMNSITQQQPEEVWSIVTKHLGPPIDSRASHIKEWLRGGGFFEEGAEGALSMIPLKKIWKWVDENVDKRAWYLSSFVPKGLFRKKEKICLAREVLVRYGNREDVRRNLKANLSSGGWSGSASLHYEKKKKDLLSYKKEENNKYVRLWIDEYVTSIDQDIQREKIEEERRGFNLQS